jgi:integrase
MFAELASTDTRYGRPPTPSTLHRIRATLRSALNAAIRDGLLRDNPARFIELPTPRRPQPQVWTHHRVDAWQRGGPRPSVAVWTAHQLASFLDSVAEDRLFAMWWLIALRGLRRGETAGLRWADVDLEQRVIVIAQQRIAFGRTVTVGPPKTQASRRTVALDRATVAHLRAHLRRQRAERDAAGRAARIRLCIHHRRRHTTAPGLDHSPIPSLGRHVRAATGTAARLAPRRRDPGPRRRRRPEDRAGTARAHQHRAHRRHLHQRPTRPALHSCRSYRPARAQSRRPQPRPPPPIADRPAEVRSIGPVDATGTGTPQAIPHE